MTVNRDEPIPFWSGFSISKAQKKDDLLSVLTGRLCVGLSI